MKSNWKIENTEVFEWYDGLVLGVIKAERLSALAFLLAFDPDRNKKRFCVIPMTIDQVAAMKELFKSKGPQMFDEPALSKIITDAPVRYLTWDEPKGGAIVELVEATTNESEQMSAPSFPMIDRAVAPEAISKWLAPEK